MLYDLGLRLNTVKVGTQSMVMTNAPPADLLGPPYAVTQKLNGTRESLLHGGAQLRSVQVLISIYGFPLTPEGEAQCGVVLAHLRARAREVDRLAGYGPITECNAADESPVQRDLPTNQHWAAIRFVLTYLQS
ncbi:hypothetical protein Dxin01_02765 [Deinococcus xinjiangensis]|uniref:Uncharacterized protein n=1 Tax=Deinococcus xinjiangensis TaxID=457454 RepID=A0ABP9VEG4_9DEIO